MTCHVFNDDLPESAWQAPITKVVVLCGAEGLVFNDGSVMPDGFDFVYRPDPHCFTDCAACLDRLSLLEVVFPLQERQGDNWWARMGLEDD